MAEEPKIFWCSQSAGKTFQVPSETTRQAVLETDDIVRSTWRHVAPTPEERQENTLLIVVACIVAIAYVGTGSQASFSETGSSIGSATGS